MGFAPSIIVASSCSYRIAAAAFERPSSAAIASSSLLTAPVCDSWDSG